MWDPNNDHKAHRFKTFLGFIKELKKAHLSGKPFRIAYVPSDPSAAEFERVAQAVWAVLDGSKPTYFVVEEYSDCCEGPGAISPTRLRFHRRLWNQGRKYGLRIVATTQRPQNISKDALGNAGVIWAGEMNLTAAKLVGMEMSMPPQEVRSVPGGTFWMWSPGREAEKKYIFTPKE